MGQSSRLWPRLTLLALACSIIVIQLAAGAEQVRASSSPQRSNELLTYVAGNVKVTRTVGGPTYAGEVFRYEEVLKINASPDNVSAIFYDPRQPFMDHNGHLYVLDTNAHRIVQFDPQGNWIRYIGRRGEGPGEMFLPVQAKIVNGMLHVLNPRLRSTQVFTTGGDYVRLDPWPQFPRVSSTLPEIWPLEGGGSVVRLLNVQRDDVRQERVEMLVYDEQGTELARVASAWVVTGRTVWREVEGRTRSISLYAHYSAKPWGGYFPGRGMWTSTGEEPAIRWYDLQGTPVERWEVDLEKEPIRQADRDAVADNLRLAVEEALDPPPGREIPHAAIARTRAQFATFADHKAFWAIPFVDDRGFLWVMESPPLGAPSQPRPESIRMMIMSPTGEFLGRTTLPGPGTASNGHLVTVETDRESLEPVVRAYRIHAAVEGLSYY